MSMELDFSSLRQALRDVEMATKKDGADIINRAAKNVCLRAIKGTPKADKAKIRAVDPKVMVAAALKRLNGQKVSGAELKRLAKRELSRRLQSAGYIKAGWLLAAKQFGAKGGRVSSKGLAGKGYGIKATESHPVAELANFARGADKVGSAAFQSAIDFVAKDMTAYAEKKMRESFSKHSA